MRWLVLLCLGLLACIPQARKKVDTDLVRSVRFDVPHRALFFSGQNNYQIRSAMEQGDSSFGATIWPLTWFAKPEELDWEALTRDAWRLEVWYAHHGWFDAEVTGWSVARVRPHKAKRAGVVDIRGAIDPGPVSLIDEFEILGMDDPKVAPLRGAIERTGLVQPGGQFDLDGVRATRLQLLRVLADYGFPYATAEVQMDARPERQEVDVEFDVVPGQLSLFGPVTIEGLDKVTEAQVRDALTLTVGQKYEASELSKSQQALFDLRTFSLAELVPDLSDPTRRDVPITVRVTETSFRTLRLGGGVRYENATLTPKLTATFEHVNVFHRLLEFKLDTGIGRSFSSRGGDTTWTVGTTLSNTRLSHGRLSLVGAASVTKDVEHGQFLYFNPKASFDARWKFSREVSVGGGTTFEVYRFLDFTGPAAVAARTLFGTNFENPFRLGTVRADAVFDWRDDPLFTTRGSFYSVGVRQAVPVLGSHFLFSELRGDARRYIRPQGATWTLGLRLQGRVLQPWNRKGVPYTERVFLGGSTSLRGFQANQVGPYDLLCVYEPTDEGDAFSGVPGAGKEVSRTYLPRGGQLGVVGTVEMRFEVPYVSLVPFVDVGILSPSVREVAARQVRFGGGVGVRYASLVGPIRFDVAVRPTYPEDGKDRFIHRPPKNSGFEPPPIDCATEDVLARTFDLLSIGQERRLAGRRPLAVNVYLTIGEAF